MPFKGDMRLGGPHDNEANLNGSSDMDGVPAAGTVLQTGLTEPVLVPTTLPNGQPISLQTGTNTYNVVADGLGGTYNVVTAQNWVPQGTFIGPSFNPSPAHTEYDGIPYPNGKLWVSRFVSDGQGEFSIGYEVDQEGDYYPLGTMVNGAPQYSIADQLTEHPSTLEMVANGKYSYDSLIWNGTGGIGMSTGQPFAGGSWYPDGTLERDAPDTNVEVPEGSGNYYFDGNDNRWEWDGNGNIVFRYSGLYGYGTFITSYNDYNYYWNGSGGFYSEYTGGGGGGGGGCDSYGTPYGSSTGQGMTIYIGETARDVPNGTYDSYSYADGNCGTQTDYTYYYPPSGTVLDVSDSIYEYEQGYIPAVDYTYNTGRTKRWSAYVADGSGYYNAVSPSNIWSGNYESYGASIWSDFSSVMITIWETGTSVANGIQNANYHYIHDGNGSYTNGPLQVGSFFSNGSPVYDEFNTHVSMYDDSTAQTVYAFWNGDGGYYFAAI